jgi:hypothetical protein
VAWWTDWERRRVCVSGGARLDNGARQQTSNAEKALHKTPGVHRPYATIFSVGDHLAHYENKSLL